MTKELKIKQDEVITIKDVNDAALGKVLMAAGIGALMGDKLKKIAKVLIIGGAIIQIPVAWRVAKRVRKLVKQAKEGQPVEAQAAEQPEAAGTSTGAPQVPAEEAPQGEVAAPAAQGVEAGQVPHVQPDGEPSTHAQEDPDN